jgi:predicted nucleotidyltransferase
MPIELLTSVAARERAERASRALAADPRVRLVFLFGSAADPDRRSVGDVDLAVFVTSARMRYFDFRYYLDEQWRLMGERLRARGHGPAD